MVSHASLVECPPVLHCRFLARQLFAGDWERQNCRVLVFRKAICSRHPTIVMARSKIHVRQSLIWMARTLESLVSQQVLESRHFAAAACVFELDQISFQAIVMQDVAAKTCCRCRRSWPPQREHAEVSPSIELPARVCCGHIGCRV